MIVNIERCLNIGYTENFLIESMKMKSKEKTSHFRVRLIEDALENGIKTTKQYSEIFCVTVQRVAQYYAQVNKKLKWLIGYYNQYGFMYSKDNAIKTVDRSYLT